MRKIGRSEIIMYKCHTCGSKNKVYTILVDSVGNKIGSSMKCCDCGTLVKRFNDLSASVKDENGESFSGKQYCIKLEKCDNCDTCPLAIPSPAPTPDPDNPCYNCSTCPYKYFCCKNQNSNKLIVNINKIDKFIK